MYSIVNDLNDTNKEIYFINLGELATLMKDVVDPEKFLSAVSGGHTLESVTLPILTIEAVYGSAFTLMAINKAKQIDGTPVVFSARQCQQFLMSCIYEWQLNVFRIPPSFGGNNLAARLGLSEDDYNLSIFLDETYQAIHRKRLGRDDAFDWIIGCALNKYHALIQNYTFKMDPGTKIALKDHLLSYVESQVTKIHYLFNELSRFGEPDPEPLDFNALLESIMFPWDDMHALASHPDLLKRVSEVEFVALNDRIKQSFFRLVKIAFYWKHKCKEI